MQPSVEIAVEIALADLPPSHPAFALAEQDLLADSRALPSILLEQRTVADEGQKGAVGGWLLKVLTPSSTNAVVELFKAWLSRDRRRSVTVSLMEPGQAVPTIIHVSGDQISLDVLTKALEAAAQHRGSH